MDPTLKIVIVGENSARTAIMENGLRDAGFTNTVPVSTTDDLNARLDALDPKAVLIDLGTPSRDCLDRMFDVARVARKPMAIFVDRTDADEIQASVDAGVSAFVVDGLRKERMKPIVELCVSRFTAFSRLKTELDKTRAALEQRKVTDRAKGILMRAKNLSEDEAYALLRRTAMNESKTIADIAQSIVTTAELMK